MLTIALKEWAIVCDLLLEGRQAILLRKGGIHESSGPGVFELEYSRFALFPSWAHQNPDSIKPPWRHRVQQISEPDQITLHSLAEVAKVWLVPNRSAFDQLDDLHCWTPPYVNMRFNYKPDRPLYLIALRAYRLSQPKTIANNPEYAGCKSWVPLRPGDEIDDQHPAPALPESNLRQLIAHIDSIFSPTPNPH